MFRQVPRAFHNLMLDPSWDANPLKETNILQDDIINSIITNLKFQHKPKKYIIFQKSSYKKKAYYLVGAKIP
jgi:hypothetical protein